MVDSALTVSMYSSVIVCTMVFMASKLAWSYRKKKKRVIRDMTYKDSVTLTRLSFFKE
jgi:hypothetical protein